MTTHTLPLYEGMFLFDPATVNTSTKTAIEEVQKILNHAGAAVEAIFKWDDRKLAYEIGKAKRGIYIQTYFRCQGEKIASIERDVSLSEVVLRVLIIRADHVGDVELEDARQKTRATADLVALEGTAEGEKARQREAAPVATGDEE